MARRSLSVVGREATPGRGSRPRSAPAAPTQDTNSTDSLQRRPSRLADLAAFQPRLDSPIYEALHAAVVAAVVHTPYVTQAADHTRLSVLYRYGAWVLAKERHFDPAKHLDDDRLHLYRLTGCQHLEESSKNTAFSVLRGIRHRTPFKSATTMARVPVSAPYTDNEWAQYRLAADELGGTRWAADALMLLDLAGELGLRPSEVNVASGEDLVRDDCTGRLALKVTNSRVSRLLPLGARLTERIGDRVGYPGHLLRPKFANRRNASNAVADRLAHHHGAFNGFQSRRARHRWIARLMLAPVSTADVLYLADLRSDNHTLTDIANYVLTPPYRNSWTFDVYQG